MAFKLMEYAQARWRAVNAPHLVALVRAGATFIKGKLTRRTTRRTRRVNHPAATDRTTTVTTTVDKIAQAPVWKHADGSAQ